MILFISVVVGGSSCYGWILRFSTCVSITATIGGMMMMMMMNSLTSCILCQCYVLLASFPLGTTADSRNAVSSSSYQTCQQASQALITQ